MARSMIKRRQEAERERIDAYEATLRRVSTVARPAPDFTKAIDEARRGFAHEVVRTSYSWRPKMKTRDPARLRLAAARHLFARYPVPYPLEQIWLDSQDLPADEVALRKRWYVTVAGGGSLYKAQQHNWLTRKEVHMFLNPPGDLTFDEAFWHAIARSYTDDVGLALRIARSRIARTPRADFAFWREVARFFAVNPVALEEIDDTCDFLAARQRCAGGCSLKGRTLASLRRQVQEWHRDVAAVARIEAMRRRAATAAGRASRQGGRWTGATLADWRWQPSAKGDRQKRETYAIVQLLTADELVSESRAMRHCVWTYASKCIAGNASIWSLRRHTSGDTVRLLTIELDRHHRAVQVRGSANRVALADERKILERWSKARGVSLL